MESYEPFQLIFPMVIVGFQLQDPLQIPSTPA